jgi:hypothetical protein
VERSELDAAARDDKESNKGHEMWRDERGAGTRGLGLGGSVAMGAVATLTAVAVLASLVLATPSFAGDYRFYSCRIPSGADVGAPAPLETVEGATETAGAWDRIANGDVQYANTCSAGGSLMAALPAGVAHSDGDKMTWEFTAPLGESIVKATLWRAGDADGGDGYLFWLAAPMNPPLSEVLDSDYFTNICAFSFGCEAGVGNPQQPLTSTNELPVPSRGLGGSHVYVNATCSLEACPSDAGDEEGRAVAVYIYAAEMELEQTSAPTVSDVAGELASASVISGEAGVSFRAEDPGSGVYQAVVEVDGSEAQRFVIDEDDGRCAPVAEGDVTTPAFLYPQPCPHTVQGHVSLDATSMAEGEHSLRVLVTDAAGNETPVLERDFEVAHPTVEPGGGSEGKGETEGKDGGEGKDEAGGTTPGEAGAGGGRTGESTPPSGAGTGTGAGSGPANTLSTGLPATLPGALQASTMQSGALGAGSSGGANGTPASPNARLKASWSAHGHGRGHRSGSRTSLTVSYGQRARLEGSLATATGTPIAHALIDVEATPRFGGARAVAMHSIRTGRHGRFALSLSRGVSSRRVELSYAATTGGAAVASVSAELVVKAGVRLKISPRRTALGGTIELDGRVLGGPIPRGGKEVVLEARSRGTRWLQFDVVHTNAHGSFSARHRFRLPGPVGYSFRAVSPSEADFPFSAGASQAVSVWER